MPRWSICGTPQTEESIYTKLPATFTTRIWPAKIPNKEQLASYGDALAPFIRDMIENGAIEGSPTCIRFSNADLMDREIEYGKAGFALQFMLSTQLSDLERYPLRIRDLVVMDTEVERAPAIVNWLPDESRMLRNLPTMSLKGDYFYQMAGHSNEFTEYRGTVLAIDPSGRGPDETGYAVVKMLNGFLYVRRAGGLTGTEGRIWP